MNMIEKVIKIYIVVPYHQKEMAKALWFRWDGEKKQWYINVKNKNSMLFFQPVIFLFELIDVAGVNVSEEEIKEVRDDYLMTSSKLLEKEDWVITKSRIYEKPKIKRVCNKCLKVDFMDLTDNKCSDCV